jgi:hypothetical protein
MHLDAAIILLHDIARSIEQQIGQGQLSEDIRRCADRLNDLQKPMSVETVSHDPVI